MMLERALADWAGSVDLSGRTRARALAADALVDVTACAIAGSAESSTRAVLELGRRFGTGTALALGSDLRLPAPWAAFVGGTAAHALDYDDNLAPSATHATAVLAPALFALADEEALPGADVLDAYLVGLEMQGRIGRFVNPGHYETGWHATSTIGTIGAAAACARLLRLGAGGILAAMSVAFSMASGSKQQFGSMMKPIHAGLAAKNAVLAARMAEAGISGDPRPLSGAWGLSELYGGTRRDEAGSALKDLDRVLVIETDGLLAKRFPCCAAAHPTLDGIVLLRETNQIRPEEVDRIDIVIPEFARANLRFDEPENEMEARFSLTYTAARVFLSGALSLNDLTPPMVSDPATRRWFGRISIVTHEGPPPAELGFEATPAVTRITLADGRSYEVAISAARGWRDAPLTEEELRGKFVDCCRWAGREWEAARLFDLARSLPGVVRFPEFSEELSRTFGAGKARQKEHA